MRKLYRSEKDKWIAGVLGGLGEYLNIDPTILRIAYIFFSIASGGFPGIVGYVLAIIIIPKTPMGYEPAPAASASGGPSQSAPAGTAESSKPSNAPLVVGVILIALGALFLFNNFIDIRWHLFWPAILIILGLVLLGKALFNSKN
jgi:phage shock protein C